jgi:hypothetical protein
MAIEFPRPQLPAKIALGMFCDAKLSLFEWCSPKSARVESGLAWLTERAFAGTVDQNFWWVGPDFSACAQALITLKNALSPGSFTIPSRTPALTLLNGAMLHFRPAENPNVLYGDSVYACVLDQAVHVSEKSYRALQETLANTRAPWRITSTVGGRANWFNELARESEDDPTSGIFYTRFNALDACEAGLLAQEDIDYARATLPDHMFRALYLAQPYDDRIEAAYKASDPRIMRDEELAIIAGLNPESINSISDGELLKLIHPNLNESNSTLVH